MRFPRIVRLRPGLLHPSVVEQLPANLSEALDNLQKDDVVKDALGDHILKHFMEAKRGEWAEYISTVQPWEVQKYLETY